MQNLKHRFKTYIFIFTILICSVANSQNFVDLSSNEKQINFLIWLQEEIPWIFEEGAEYDIDFFTLMQNMQTLQDKNIKNNLDFKDLYEDRAESTTITITEFANTELIERQITKPSLKAIGKRLELQELYGTSVSQAQKLITKKIKALVNNHYSLTYRSIVNTLNATLTSSTKKKRLNNSNILTLKKLLRSKNFITKKDIAKVDFERLGLDQTTSRKDFLDLIQKSLENETLLAEYGVILTLLETLPKRSNLEPSFLINAKRIASKKEITATLLSTLDNSKINKKIAGTSASYMQATAKDVSVGTKKQTLVSYRISEVPPHLGVFRGIVGGDCSTEKSFPIAYAPYEHIYYIYNDDEQLIGYAQATEVEYKDKYYFYLHDIVGARLPGTATNLIVEAISQYASKIGFKGLLLPSIEIMKKNINYETIHHNLENILLENDYTIIPRVDYLDSEIRPKLVKNLNYGTSLDYDTEDENTSLHLYETPAVDTDNIIISMKKNHTKTPKLNKNKPSYEQTFIQLLHILYFERSEDSQNALRDAVDKAIDGQDDSKNFDKRRALAWSIASTSGVDLNQVNEINYLLRNPKKLKINKFYENLRVEFEELGISFQKLMKNHYAIFEYGHLNSSDLEKSENSKHDKLTVEFTIKAFKRWNTSEIALKAYLKAPGLFLHLEKWNRFIEGLVRPDEESLKKLLWLIDNDVQISEFLQQFKPKIEFMVSNDFEDYSNYAKKLLKKIKINSSCNKSFTK